MPTTKPTPHVVIIGAGFAGLYAARALAKTEVRITLVDRRNHHTFQPLLYQVATAALSPGEIAYPIRHIFKKDPNVTLLIEQESDAVGRAERQVEDRIREMLEATMPRMICKTKSPARM